MKPEKQSPPELDQTIVRAYMRTFIPRFDLYPVQRPDGRYVQYKKPLTLDKVVAHLQGRITLAAYALDADSQARWLCLDADEDDQFTQLVSLTRDLEARGITGYLEQSRRGGHLWLFTPRIRGRDARRFGQQLMAQHKLPTEIELYPKQDELRTGPGSMVRLPLGVHRKSGTRYHFITPGGAPLAATIREQIAILSQPQIIPQSFIDTLLAQAPEPETPKPTPDFGGLQRGQGETLSETLKATVSVPDFVGRFVTLDRQGRGLCPFHDDQHQSFQVSAEDNFWHCYAGCGGGSIIDFWMKMRETQGQDGSFTETIKELREMLLG